MTDKEQLEWAAKAAGIEWFRHTDGGLWTKTNGIWNPRKDDGDAMRLAVKLKLHVSIFDDAIGIGWNGYEEFKYEGDRCEAARRAIAQTAAEIGKAMP